MEAKISSDVPEQRTGRRIEGIRLNTITSESGGRRENIGMMKLSDKWLPAFVKTPFVDLVVRRVYVCLYRNH